MEAFKIGASETSLVRLPERVAEALGYFAQAGLQVSSYVPEPWNKILADAQSGECQCVAGSVWMPSLYHNRVRNYAAFAKAASRCPMALVSRTPVNGFSWKNIEGKVVLVPGSNDAGLRMFFTGCAREAGVDLAKVKLVHDFYAPMLFECFQGGWGDMVVLEHDLADTLVAAGKGYLAADLSVVGGAVPWLVYYATPEFLGRSGDLAGKFTLALQKATAWLLEHDGAACRKLLGDKCPGLAAEAAVKRIDQYRANGMWDATVDVKEAELRRWEGFMAESRLIDKPIPYGELVDSRPYAYAAGR